VLLLILLILLILFVAGGFFVGHLLWIVALIALAVLVWRVAVR
jgi:hypothetical protein